MHTDFVVHHNSTGAVTLYKMLNPLVTAAETKAAIFAAAIKTPSLKVVTGDRLSVVEFLLTLPTTSSPTKAPSPTSSPTTTAPTQTPPTSCRDLLIGQIPPGQF